MFKVGRTVIDPSNRRCTITDVDRANKTVTVRLYGPYGAHVIYPMSCVRLSEED
jgi:hypothetical protein